MFTLDARIKRECIWHGPLYRKSTALVDRRNNFVWLSTTRDEEPVFLTQHLAETDSMMASIADPQRAPEMLAVREAVRGWRFYVSHASRLLEQLAAASLCAHLHLLKSFGETTLEGATFRNTPKWKWPAR